MKASKPVQIPPCQQPQIKSTAPEIAPPPYDSIEVRTLNVFDRLRGKKVNGIFSSNTTETELVYVLMPNGWLLCKAIGAYRIHWDREGVEAVVVELPDGGQMHVQERTAIRQVSKS